MKKRIIIIAILLLAFAISFIGYYNYKKINSFHGEDLLDLKSGNHHLLFYGSIHSNDRTNPMFKEIEKYFYETNPQIVFVEGDNNLNNYTSQEQAISNGESAFVTYLAKKNNIPVKSIEPSMKEQYDYLLKKYDKNQVLLMYIFRQIYQYQNEQKNSPINFERALGDYVNSMAKQGFPLDSNEIKTDNILSLMKSYMNKDINNNNWTSVDVHSEVYNKGSNLNDIYNDILNMRNKFVSSTIQENLKGYDKIFIIMGGDHVKKQKSEIEMLFNKVTKSQ